MLKKNEKEFIKNILLGFVDCHTNAKGVVPEEYEDTETVEEVAICKGILEKLNTNNGGIKLKKIFQLFIFTLSLLIFSSNVNAKVFTFNPDMLPDYVTEFKQLPDITVTRDKQFTINFNKEIDYTTINDNTIKIFNSKGEEVAVTVASKASNKKVGIVLPPSNGYIEGETYALVVTDGIKDLNGKNLKQETVMYFLIKSAAAQDPPKEESNKSEDEVYIDNLYKTNSPYWNFGAKYVDGKLNLNFYDYTTQKSSWKSLSTSFNPNINKQVIDTFKALYTEKEGYQTYIEYGLGEDSSGMGTVKLYGENLTPWGEEFININFYTSSNATILSKNVYASLLIPQCSTEQFNNNKALIKAPLSVVVGETNSNAIYDYITSEYKKRVLDNSTGAINYTQHDKTFNNIKVSTWSNGKRFVVEFTKL